jgi:hypothetical protein
MLSRGVRICVGMVEISAIISDVPVYYPELMLVNAVYMQFSQNKLKQQIRYS